MLKPIAQNLDRWVQKENQLAFAEGRPQMRKVVLKIIGQTALLEAKLSIELAATMDVDCYNRLNAKVREQFNLLLQEKGKYLDDHGHEAWMPKETQFDSLYTGKNVHLFIAQPVFVILSKAKTAPRKNADLILDYIASDDLDDRLFDLAEKYNVDLEFL